MAMTVSLLRLFYSMHNFMIMPFLQQDHIICDIISHIGPAMGHYLDNTEQALHLVFATNNIL